MNNDKCKNASVVCFSQRINTENLVKAYKAPGREAKGRVAVKLSTGEAGNPYLLSTDVIDYAEELGLGSQNYVIKNIEPENVYAAF